MGAREIAGKDKVIAVPKHHSKKIYGGVEVKLHAFLISALDGNVPLRAKAVLGLFSGKDSEIHIGYKAGRTLLESP